jgi:hypothetical protein
MADRRVLPVVAWATATLALAQGAQFVDRTPASLASFLLVEVAAADFDGDGDVDLCGGATFFGAPQPVVLLRNDGAERFVDVSAALPALPVSWACSVLLPFDMDADGDLDLLLCNQGASRLWRNVGNLTFVDATANLPVGTTGYTDAVAADFDGDGDLDVVGLSGVLAGNNSKLFLNQGNGTFATSPTFPTANGWGVAVADFDQDGDPDVAIARGSLRLLRNDGNQVFTDVSAAWLPGVTLANVTCVAFGDFVPGGPIDLAVGASYGGGNAEVVLWNGGTSFTVGSATSTAATPISLLAADVDEDGDVDLVLGRTGMLRVALNDGLGNLAVAPSRLALPVVQSPVLAGGDVDRDGDVDVLVADSGGFAKLLVDRHRDLRPGQPVVGGAWNVEIASEPGYATLHHTVRLAIALAPLTPPLPVPGFGELALDLGAGYAFFEGIVLANVGSCTWSFAVPPAPALVGLSLYLQGLAEQGLAPARFTAAFGVAVQ